MVGKEIADGREKVGYNWRSFFMYNEGQDLWEGEKARLKDTLDLDLK